ncbi:ABC transporter permease [Bacillus sp. 2205SS5-2]|uniref:ABC transporter permease n=1 Tax=Bacillus sp. 2205SS5-2 TaxID=3109031 RepID=UPI003003BC92
MKSIESIWKQRVTQYNRELQKYLRYMLNDHLLFVLIFALGGGAYTYNEWVATLDHTFPAEIIMAVVLGGLLVFTPIYTFLEEADSVYLLPIEGRMKGYFRKSILISFLFQAYIPLLVLAGFMPMYVQVTNGSFSTFFTILLIFLVIKGWNLFIKWNVLKFQETEIIWMDNLIRTMLNIILLFFIFVKSGTFFILATGIIFITYGLYFYLASKGRTLKWERLINMEASRLLRFYRLANLFTDVPKLKGQVHRRKWLDPFLKKETFTQESSYPFLYTRTFLRSSEYFGLYIRLTLLSMLLLYVNDWIYFQVFISVLFLYLTGFQLIPLLKKHNYVIWLTLYPLSKGAKREAFLALVQKLLVGQAILFSVIPALMGQWQHSIMVLIINLVVVVVMISVYIPKRMKKIQD